MHHRLCSFRALLLLGCGVFVSTVSAQVVINEVSAVHSQRLLQKEASGLSKLGNLPAWYANDFTVPTWWKTNAGPIGFGYAQTTNVQSSMVGKTPVLYLRRTFVATAAQVSGDAPVRLLIDYDDGFVAYLNGVEVARRNTGAARSFAWHNQPAFNLKTATGDESIELGTAATLLRSGDNVLAIQVHNRDLGDGSLRCSATLQLGTGSFTNLVVPSAAWSWFAGISEPSGGLYDARDIATVAEPDFVDWLELKNLGNDAVNLSGWTLTDSAATPARWTLPAGVNLAAHGFLVIACTGRNVTAPLAGGLLHTNFGLSSKGEYLALRNANGAVQSVISNVPDQDAFHTWGLDPTTQQYSFLARGTPGAENGATESDVRTSDVTFDKTTGFYGTPLSIALATDTPGATIRYTLDGSEPTTSNGTDYTGPFDPTARPVIGPGEGGILREFFQWNSFIPPANLPANATPTTTQIITSLETPSNIAELYTHRVRGFLQVPQTGAYEFWLATDDDGQLWLSTDEAPANKRKIAYIDSNWAGVREWTKIATQHSVSINLVAGQRYYIEALQSEGGGGDNLAVGWSGPGLPAGINVIEGRYLSPPAVVPAGTLRPSGYGTVRARAFASGRLLSRIDTRNYVTGMDPRLATVPAFFLSGPGAETFYPGNGIFSIVGGQFNGSWSPTDARFDYNFCLMHGEAFERPAALEIVNPGNQLVERTTAGVRFSGSPWSRPQYRLQGLEQSAWNNDWSTKPQLNIFFRGDYGISKLKKNGFIPTSTLKEWDELRLRAGKNDAYNPFIIDEWMRRTFAALGAPSPQGFLATLFVNGQFKSYFNPTERIREPFLQEFYQTASTWDINYIGDWESGDPVAFNQMQSYFLANDFTTLAKYQTGASYWDMTNVADYFIVNAWGAVQDWPHNNYVLVHERVPTGKWRFSMWDAEGAMGMFGQGNDRNTFDADLLTPENGARSPAINQDYTITRLIFRRAYQNAEFRMLFADRLQKHFFNGGPMTRANLNARWNSLRASAEPLIGAVFNGSLNNGYWDNWANRDATFLAQCRTIGLWPATLAPAVAPFGGTVAAGAAVTLTKQNAGDTIYFSTDGRDPRAVGGSAQGDVYSAALPVAQPFTLKARSKSAAGEWSPLVEVDFAPPPQRLLITELNYNPGGDGLAEFLELTNVSDQPASLNGAHFTTGIDFTFGNVTLAPHASVVLVKSAAAFTAAHPGVATGGVYTGSLANEGETITLRDLAETVILVLTYGDNTAPGWPPTADGGGASLVLRRPFRLATDPALPASWRPSDFAGGDPGLVNSTEFTGDPAADQDGDGQSALLEYALGTSDTDPLSTPKIAMTRNTAGQLEISFTRPLSVEDVTIEALESTALGTWQSAIPDGEILDPVTRTARATWHSTNATPPVFLRLRARLP